MRAHNVVHLKASISNPLLVKRIAPERSEVLTVATPPFSLIPLLASTGYDIRMRQTSGASFVDDLLAPAWETVRAEVEKIVQEKLGHPARILGYRKSIEENDYAIYVEVPLDICLDLDLTSRVGGEILQLSDRMGIPFFAYFVPA